ncbi:MAG: hypothetical protein JXR61_08290 [Prolixibacteraceae bacterium]|nr:hypothetical protein [Prolixibacteraceae bacterium]
MIKYLLQFLAVAVTVISLISCEDEGYLNSPDAQLMFSVDTVTFDTIFTTIGSTTRHFTVHNPYDEDILISRIELAGGDASNFRLNINGEEANELYELEIPARDSIYVFVEVTVDPNGQNTPMIVQDSIKFTTNANLQNVKLIAYGQDFKLIKRETIGTSTWTAEKPYLVFDYALVDSLSELTIEPGTRIYFHKNAGLFVKGKIIANGTFQQPIKFTSDRLEESYENIPDQWDGIVLFSGSHDNVFNFCTIKNANIGLQVGTLEHEGFASALITNTRVENMAYAGIFAMKSKIVGYNDLIANCGFYAMALLIGGQYQFFHTTVANYWGGYSSKARTTPALTISNTLVYKDLVYVGDLEEATFANSIIYGNNNSEIELGNNNESMFNYYFENCIIQVPDTFKTTNTNHYKNVWKGRAYDPKFIDPYLEYNYSLDTLSPAKDIGNSVYNQLFPFDILNNRRDADDGPDLGAFERIEKRNDN